MKRRWRTKNQQHAGSGEASAGAAAPGRKDQRKPQQQQQRSGGADRSASSGEQISGSRSASSGEEITTARSKRQRNREKRRWSAVPMPYFPVGRDKPEENVALRQPSFAVSPPSNTIVESQAAGEASVVPAAKKKGKPKTQQKRSSTGKSTHKDRSSSSQSAVKNAQEEESSLSHPAGKVSVGGGEISSGDMREPNQEQDVKHSRESADQAISNSEGDAPEAGYPEGYAQMTGEAVAPPTTEVAGVSSMRATLNIMNEVCLDDASQSRSGSVEAQGEASFDEETSTWLKLEQQQKKPQPSSSGELGVVAQGENELSDKKTCDGDLGKMIAHDEDDQRPDKIGVPAIDIQEQGKEVARWPEELDLDDDTLSEKIADYFEKLRSDHPTDDREYLPPYEPHQLTELYEQLALYRIRGYQLYVDQQLAELDDENLKKHYSSADMYDESYFKYYEESLEWYFDPELCKFPELDNYQRLVLRKHIDYVDWDYYHSTLNTYEKDMAYVRYCEALANETKWIKDYLVHGTYQWKKVENVALLQALQVAEGFLNVSSTLVLFAFHEHIYSILFDHSTYKDMDGVYFEIWKRVAKFKKDFREALLELHRENMFPMRAGYIEQELANVTRAHYLKDNYDAYVAGIDDMTSDDKALQCIREAVFKMVPKDLIYVDYIQKKIDIAKDILLIGEAPPELMGDDSEAKLAKDN